MCLDTFSQTIDLTSSPRLSGTGPPRPEHGWRSSNPVVPQERGRHEDSRRTLTREPQRHAPRQASDWRDVSFNRRDMRRDRGMAHPRHTARSHSSNGYCSPAPKVVPPVGRQRRASSPRSHQIVARIRHYPRPGQETSRGLARPLVGPRLSSLVPRRASSASLAGCQLTCAVLLA